MEGDRTTRKQAQRKQKRLKKKGKKGKDKAGSRCSPLNGLFESNDLFPKVLSFLDARFICTTAALVNKQWRQASQDPRLWKALYKRDFGYLFSCSSPQKVTRPASSSSWFSFYQDEALAAHWTWDTSYFPDEIVYNGLVCDKRPNTPDITFVFGNKAYSKGRVGWEIEVLRMGQELRVGFTTSVAALAQERTFYTLSQPHLYCYSDGSWRRGYWAAGKRLSEEPERYRQGDKVGIQLDFIDGKVRLYKNKVLQGEFPLPKGDQQLVPCVAMDEGHDRIKLIRPVCFG
ncbi:hypothetical protein QOT17_009075 [Balamuthia mandrillaris]